MYIPMVLAELQITDENFMVDVRSMGTGTEKVNTVQVRDVYTSRYRKYIKIKQFKHLNFKHKMR